MFLIEKRELYFEFLLSGSVSFIPVKLSKSHPSTF